VLGEESPVQRDGGTERESQSRAERGGHRRLRPVNGR
jgi:hypothetical protein